MRLLLILILFNAHFLSAQGWFSHYLPLNYYNVATYEEKVINDTIWLSREDTLAFQPRRKDYRFKFSISTGRNVYFKYSRRLGGADPDFNCDFPKQTLKKGDSGEITICFPGRIMTPPYVHTRSYLVNSNTSIRDTLVINRHFRWSDRDTICTSLVLGDSIVTLVDHAVNSRAEIIFLNLHENEITSIEALKIIADSIPIDYLYIQHGGERRVTFSKERNQYSVDPNRIFTKIGRKATLDKYNQQDTFGLETSEYLATQIIRKLRRGKAIISVHNNSPDGYSILSYLPDAGESENTGELFINEAADPDDFIYTTDSTVYAAAKRDCINVILQSKDHFVDDGSLSIYCGMEGILYINVETELGHLTEQVRLILWARKIVGEILKSYPLNP